MAVALDSVTTGDVGAAASVLTLSHTLTGSDLGLIVFVSGNPDEPVVNTVRSANQVFTQVARVAQGAGNGATHVFMESWKFTAPASGATDIGVHLDSNADFSVVIYSFTGANQTDLVTSAASTANDRSNGALSVRKTFGANHMTVDCRNQYAATSPTAGADQSIHVPVWANAADSNLLTGSSINTAPSISPSQYTWTNTGSNANRIEMALEIDDEPAPGGAVFGAYYQQYMRNIVIG